MAPARNEDGGDGNVKMNPLFVYFEFEEQIYRYILFNKRRCFLM